MVCKTCGSQLTEQDKFCRYCGTTVDTAPKAAPKHPTSDTTTSKFATLNLQFGRNYDPKNK